MANKPSIFLTNDDSIDSPGLWAAAEALAEIGDLTIVAPAEQQTSMGRSFPRFNDCKLEQRVHTHKGTSYPAFAINGSPAQSVAYGLRRIMNKLPDLVVSGINYGENIGSGLTISGTVGAALEASNSGIRALAVSLQVDPVHHFSLDDVVDFSVAAWFTALFARKALAMPFPPDVDVLKIEVPEFATRDTPWVTTRQSRERYYYVAQDAELDEPLRYVANPREPGFEQRTDLQVLIHEGLVAVTPLSLDLTSRVDLDELQKELKSV